MTVYGYDATNRRISQSATDTNWWSYPASATSISYTANSLNRYTAVGAVTPSYDGNGNLTSDGTFTYGYDAENRLVSASGSGLTAGYAYDAQGRRKSKTVNGTTTIYVTDADNREVLEYDGTSGATENWYSYGLGSNDVLNQMNVAGGTRATFIPDVQGSFIGTLDAASGTLTKNGYQTYGESVSTSGSFRYTGQRIDPETAGSIAQPSGLYYYRARVYAPGWGRFMQPDPIGYAGGSNLYAYVGNDPLNLIDPFGTDGLIASFGFSAFYGLGTSPDSPAGLASNTTVVEGLNGTGSLSASLLFGPNGSVNSGLTGTIGAGAYGTIRRVNTAHSLQSWHQQAQ